MHTLDLEQLRNITLDDEELMREVLSALLDDTTRQIISLEQAIRSADAKETVRVAHYVKGACANVGAQSAAAVLKDIERTAARGDFGTCHASLAALRTEVDKLRSEAARV